MSGVWPNQLHYDHDGHVHSLPLGEFHSVRRHGDHFCIWLKWGSRLDVSEPDLRRLYRAAAAALAGVPWRPENTDVVHDAIEVDE